MITRERALQNITTQSTFTDDEFIRIDQCILTATKAIEKYCQRQFTVNLRDELYNGTGTQRLMLKNFPVVSVERVAYSPTVVLTAKNTASTVQRASLKIHDTGIDLIRLASGLTTVNTILFSDEPTITELSAAITAIGNGWTSSVPNSSFGSYASADLRALQGAMFCKNTDADLRLHTEELSAFEVDAGKGILIKGFAGNEFGDQGPVWFGGINYWRVIYTSGFAELPPDVEEACASWTSEMWHRMKRDPGLSHEAIVGSVARSQYGFIPPNVIELLRPHRNHQIMSFGG